MSVDLILFEVADVSKGAEARVKSEASLLIVNVKSPKLVSFGVYYVAKSGLVSVKNGPTKELGRLKTEGVCVKVGI